MTSSDIQNTIANLHLCTEFKSQIYLQSSLIACQFLLNPYCIPGVQVMKMKWTVCIFYTVQLH